MKKLLSLSLALVLCLALAAPVFAADTVLPSPQALVFDGYGVEDVTAYNINGYNYFKLRDIAALMSGTAGEFAVGWDAASGTVTVTTGGRYVFVGGELMIGADQSASAVPSPQALWIDGEKVDSLSVYNIGGNNYFRLRDLGDALGFGVDYDAAWNAAIVTPPQAAWLMVGETHKDASGSMTITFTYDENGRLTGYSADDGSTNSVLTYNEYGVVVHSKAFGGEGEDAWEMETAYNGRGAVVSERSRSAYSTETTEYAYNAKGVLTGSSSGYISEDYTATHEDVYNEQGQLIRTVNTSAGADGTGETCTYTYTYDDKGRVVSYEMRGSGTSIGFSWDENGEPVEETEPFSYVAESNTVYADGSSTETVHNVYTYADGSKSVTDSVGVTVFDAKGNILSRKDTNTTEGESELSERRYTYNEAGKLLTEAEYYNGAEEPESTETYTYDASGRVLSDRRESADGSFTCMTYTYDADGNCIADSYEERYFEYDWDTDTRTAVTDRSSSTYTYDGEGRLVRCTSESGSEKYVRTLVYDADGKLLRETVTVNGTETEAVVYSYRRAD